jgi:hypothetical protein
MNTSLRVVGFLAALAALFWVAVGVGQAVDPIASPDADDHGHTSASPTENAEAETGAADLPGGLMVSQDGYTFALTNARAQAGNDVPVTFTITGPDGQPVTAYDVEHDEDLHLIAVRRDFTGFQHVHPTLDADSGLWSIDLDLTAGQWRLFADFTATGAEATTLGADLTVSGTPELAAPGPDSRTAEVDGYTVTLDGELTPGADAELTLNVSKDGRPVTDLEPYLGAYGHLVALREGDLAYLHVHPDGTPGDGSTEPGPDVVFFAEVPSASRYHLYLDFKHDGVVRTAAFTVTAEGATPKAGHAEDTADTGDTGDTDDTEHGDH